MIFFKSLILCFSKGEEGPGPQVQDGGREQVCLLPDLGSCCCAQSQQGAIRILEPVSYKLRTPYHFQNDCLGF